MILDKIVAQKRAAVARRNPITKAALELAVREASLSRRDFAAALRQPRLSVIAEFKRKSPSAGAIAEHADVAKVTRGYQRAGARALSILTDGPFFGGSLADAQAGRAATALPVLRKDFVIDEYDLEEACVAGLDAVLLIVRILTPSELSHLVSRARALGLGALVETHTHAEIDIALAAGATIVGVNHRDLDTLTIDLGLSADVRARVGPEILVVAESGLKTKEDFERMRAHGADAVLVGEALMKEADPGAALERLLDVR